MTGSRKERDGTSSRYNEQRYKLSVRRYRSNFLSLSRGSLLLLPFIRFASRLSCAWRRRRRNDTTAARRKLAQPAQQKKNGVFALYSHTPICSLVCLLLVGSAWAASLREREGERAAAAGTRACSCSAAGRAGTERKEPLCSCAHLSSTVVRSPSCSLLSIILRDRPPAFHAVPRRTGDMELQHVRKSARSKLGPLLSSL